MAECLTASLKVHGNATSEEGNEKNSKDAVNKFKKVRFSRDNETREYEPSANPKPRWSRRKTTLANPVSKESGHNNLSKEKSTASQKGEESKNTARDSVEARNGFRRSIRNMAKGTDSELMKVDVVSTITSSGAQFEGNASTIEGKGENEVVGVMKECEGVVQIKESSKGLGRNGCRRKSVAHLSDQVESYGQQVFKEAGKRSKNSDFEVANEVKASLDSREQMEKASITAAGPRRSRRKAAVLSSTAATSEQGAREAVGKVKQSNENVSGEDAKVSNELRRSTRNASRQSSVATCNEMNDIVDVVSTIASSGAQFAGNASTIEEFSKGLGRKGSRRKSVAHLSDQVESYGQQVLKEARKRSKNLDFEVANEVKASLDSLEHMEKASITAAGQRRSSRKAAVLSSTAATNEQKAGEAVGKVKQSNENVSGEDAIVSNELRRDGYCNKFSGASISALHSAIGEEMDTATNLEVNLASTPLTLASAATEEDTGLTIPEAAFETLRRERNQKAKPGKRNVATVDVSALHSDIGEEMDTATNLEKNLASTPLKLASAATEESIK
ncbi:hypothetical protein GH714_020269 [Hevea brasiliensis]|uniref:Uncharacterized protein n=1 Tax=Hevea brasiliensis TaxID=3981 RepID=A0A6A6KR66_HEVBR|nr:hypothetical protein GH714_020269 [Hevea brasiliensis]